MRQEVVLLERTVQCCYRDKCRVGGEQLWGPWSAVLSLTSSISVLSCLAGRGLCPAPLGLRDLGHIIEPSCYLGGSGPSSEDTGPQGIGSPCEACQLESSVLRSEGREPENGGSGIPSSAYHLMPAPHPSPTSHHRCQPGLLVNSSRASERLEEAKRRSRSGF